MQLVGNELLYSYTKTPAGFTEKVRILNHCLPLLVNDTTYLYVRTKAVKYCDGLEYDAGWFCTVLPSGELLFQQRLPL